MFKVVFRSVFQLIAISRSWRSTQYSMLAYCAHFPTFKDGTCRICDPHINLDSNATIISPDTFSQGYVGTDSHRKTIYISFRGTVNLGNWITNADFAQSEQKILGRDVKIHDGFYNSYDAFKQNIQNAVAPVIRANSDFSIITIGHSYGCSIATLTAVDLLVSSLAVDPAKISLVSFGCPRLGDHNFSLLVNEMGFNRIDRVVHSRDIVPRVPFIPLNYHHFGTEYHIDVDALPAPAMFQCNDKILEGESAYCVNRYPVSAIGAESHTSYWSGDKEEYCLQKTGDVLNITILPFYIDSS